jgi:hypothetical protein
LTAARRVERGGVASSSQPPSRVADSETSTPTSDSALWSAAASAGAAGRPNGRNLTTIVSISCAANATTAVAHAAAAANPRSALVRCDQAIANRSRIKQFWRVRATRPRSYVVRAW